MYIFMYLNPVQHLITINMCFIGELVVKYGSLISNHVTCDSESSIPYI